MVLCISTVQSKESGTQELRRVGVTAFFPPPSHATTLNILPVGLQPHNHGLLFAPHHTCEHRTEVGAAGCQDHTVGFYLNIFCHNYHVTQ